MIMTEKDEGFLAEVFRVRDVAIARARVLAVIPGSERATMELLDRIEAVDTSLKGFNQIPGTRHSKQALSPRQLEIIDSLVAELARRVCAIVKLLPKSEVIKPVYQNMFKIEGE